MTTVKCRKCGEVSDAEDIVCRCSDMQTKTITLPMDMADRIEHMVETGEDAGELRRLIREAQPN